MIFLINPWNVKRIGQSLHHNFTENSVQSSCVTVQSTFVPLSAGQHNNSRMSCIHQLTDSNYFHFHVMSALWIHLLYWFSSDHYRRPGSLQRESLIENVQLPLDKFKQHQTCTSHVICVYHSACSTVLMGHIVIISDQKLTGNYIKQAQSSIAFPNHHISP